MPDLPEEALQAAAEVLYREYASEFGADHLSWRDFTSTARAVLAAAAPVLAAQVRRETAEQIAAAIRERGQEQALDCWCHDSYADLARQIGEVRDPC